MIKGRGGNVQPIVILLLAFCVLVCAVLVFLWKDSGYYKQTLDKYGEMLATQKIWSEAFKKMEADVSACKVTNQNLQKEIDTLYSAFQNVCAEQLRLKSEPPKPITISPITIEVVKKAAPKLAAPPKIPTRTFKTNVRSKVKEAKENGKGL